MVPLVSECRESLELPKYLRHIVPVWSYCYKNNNLTFFSGLCFHGDIIMNVIQDFYSLNTFGHQLSSNVSEFLAYIFHMLCYDLIKIKKPLICEAHRPNHHFMTLPE